MDIVVYIIIGFVIGNLAYAFVGIVKDELNKK